MKKLLITFALTAVAVVSTQAQGLVFFQNNNTAKIETNTVAGGAGAGTQTITGAGNYYFALFFSTTTTTVGGGTAGMIGANVAASTNTTTLNAATYVWNASGWITASNSALTGALIGTNSGVANGRFASTLSDASVNTTIGNLGSVIAANFVVVGWSANIGSTLAQLEAWYADPTVSGWVGESQVSGSITTGNGGSQTTPNIMNGTPPQDPTFTLGLVPAPEPASMALVAIGGASLLLFRRKK